MKFIYNYDIFITYKYKIFINIYANNKRVGDYLKDRELKKLSRMDLLEILIEKSKENEKLKEELEELKNQLADRSINIKESGSIAEAALKLNGVFEAAQAAADQYLENLHRISQQTLHIKDSTIQTSDDKI